MTSTPSEEQRFLANAKILVSAVTNTMLRLHDQGYKVADPRLVAMAGHLIDNFEPKRLIAEFIRNSHSTWNAIKQRDESFFLKNAGRIFAFLPVDQVNMFRDMFYLKDKNGRSAVDDKIKGQIWDLFHAMVKVCIKHVHVQRQPTSSRDGYTYRRPDAFGEVDLEAHSQTWGVVLRPH